MVQSGRYVEADRGTRDEGWGAIALSLTQLIGPINSPTGVIPHMQVIPTRHRGVEYRSLTEAEWAAVLSAHAIEHQYEPTRRKLILVASR
jgi:hypothetical protein